MSHQDNNQHNKYGIDPSRFYRKHHPETKLILRLGETATNEAIDDDMLDPPVTLTADGRAKGWWGWQIIAFMERRIDAAKRQAAQSQQTTQKKQTKKSGRHA